MPNHDRFECQTAIDSDAILQPSRHEAESLKRRAHHSPYVCTLSASAPFSVTPRISSRRRALNR
ncbi:hypothetical protein FWY34_10165 [Escherichia coli]|nr:hypothetical protein [Escherichia coli]